MNYDSILYNYDCAMMGSWLVHDGPGLKTSKSPNLSSRCLGIISQSLMMHNSGKPLCFYCQIRQNFSATFVLSTSDPPIPKCLQVNVEYCLLLLHVYFIILSNNFFVDHKIICLQPFIACKNPKVLLRDCIFFFHKMINIILSTYTKAPFLFKFILNI